MPPTVQRACARYVAARSVKGEFRPQTTQTVRHGLRQFADHVGPDTPVERLTKRQVREWWASFPCSPNTARTRLSFVRQWNLWCIDQGWMRADLTAGIRPPRIRRVLPVTLKPEQVRQVLLACPGPRERLMMLLMVQLGMRAGEVANAQTGDVDLANRLMRIQGKGGHERVEPIPAELFLALVVWLRTAPAGPLIGREVGSSWLPLSRKHISVLTSRIMYASGVKVAAGDMISAHALRRTAISDVLESGAPLNVVQAFAGHTESHRSTRTSAGGPPRNFATPSRGGRICSRADDLRLPGRRPAAESKEAPGPPPGLSAFSDVASLGDGAWRSTGRPAMAAACR